MKRLFIIVGLLLAAASLQAQEVETSAPVDSLLLGKSIFTVMGPGVKVDQSSEVRQAMTQYVGKNAFNYTPWYSAWQNDENSSQSLIVGDGVLIGWKGDKPEELPENVKYVADGVFD